MRITNDEFNNLIIWSGRISTSYTSMTPKAQKAFDELYNWLYERDSTEKNYIKLYKNLGDCVWNLKLKLMNLLVMNVI